MSTMTKSAPGAVRTLDIARPTVLKTHKKKVTKDERVSVFDRECKGAPVQIRQGLAESYEGLKSARESWWRVNIRETPNPGRYDPHQLDTFLVDLDKSTRTYSFKSDGRRIDPQPFGKGSSLLPGAYEFKNLTEELSDSNLTYTFKNTGRQGDLLNQGIKDKDIDVPPNLYSLENYLSLETHDPKNKSYIFKSNSKRFPTIHFVPKEGPAPGQYNVKPIKTPKIISSSFMSGTPRFHTSHTRVPGPGMYEPTFQNPQAQSVEKMGRHHGLFFTCSFQR